MSVGFWVLYVLSPAFRFRFLLTPKSPKWVRPILQPDLTIGDTFLLYVLKWNLETTLYEALLRSISLEVDEIQMKRFMAHFRKHVSPLGPGVSGRLPPAYCPV